MACMAKSIKQDIFLSKEKQPFSIETRNRIDLCGSPAFLKLMSEWHNLIPRLFLKRMFVYVRSREHDCERILSALGHGHIFKKVS